MMKAQALVDTAKKIQSLKTVYLWGGWGQALTNAIIEAKARQYPSVYYPAKVTRLKALVPKGYLGIDCSGLIKMILWGYPNQKYNGGGIPDTNANGMINMCSGVSSNFNNIDLGEALWMPGHIGIYAGKYDGVDWVIESTPSWKDGVQWTKLNARKWQKHGKLPGVDYTMVEEVKPMENGSKVTATALNVRTGPGTGNEVVTTLKKGDAVKVEGKNGKWLKISAWVSGDFISEEIKKGRVESGNVNLNVRSGTNTSFPIVDKLSTGDIVTIHERIGDWIKIADGKYVHGNFVVAL